MMSLNERFARSVRDPLKQVLGHHHDATRASHFASCCSIMINPEMLPYILRVIVVCALGYVSLCIIICRRRRLARAIGSAETLCNTHFGVQHRTAVKRCTGPHGFTAY